MAREPAGSIPRPNLAAVPASTTGRSVADNARSVRDELVHAVMPELRTLVESLVKTTVERSIAPLLDRQRELEAKLEGLASSLEKQRALPASVEPAATPCPNERRGLEAAIQSAHAPIAPAVDAAPRPVAAKPLPARFTATPDANAAWDIPNELNGSRRKRTVIWILAIAVVLLLLSVAGLSLLSNTGRYL